MWTEELECELCEVIAVALRKYGIPYNVDDESVGWTPEMAAQAMQLLQQQVKDMT